MLYLEFLRRQHVGSQAQLANRTGLLQERISLYERGLRPTVAHMRALGEFFGFAPDSAYRLFEAVPDSLDPAARRRTLEAEFAGQVDRIVMRRNATAAPDTGVPPPPSLAERIRKESGR